MNSADKKCGIGLAGFAVMGENLVLNVESHGFQVAVFNHTTSKVDDFMNVRAKGKNIVGCHSIEELVANLERPRKVLLYIGTGVSGGEEGALLSTFSGDTTMARLPEVEALPLEHRREYNGDPGTRSPWS